MRRNPLAVTLITLLGVSAAVSVGNVQQVDAAQALPKPKMIQAEAFDNSPASRVEAAQAMDSAIAAALIGAVSGQFTQAVIEVKLAEVDVMEASFRDRQLQGRGELRIGDDRTWIPFEYEALFDTQEGSVSYPRLVIGAGQNSDSVATGSPLARQLNARANAALGDEFAQQPVSLSLKDVRSSPAGERYLRVEASGMADFGVEGNTSAQVQGLYDQHSGRWVQVSYELGAAPSWAPAGVELASR